MNEIKYTREQYMNKECTFREYMGQFVTNYEKQQVLRRVGLDELLKSKDEHLNDIPLKIWDSMSCHPGIGAELKQAGTYLTLSDIVCINKEAAKQIIEDHKGVSYE